LWAGSHHRSRRLLKVRSSNDFAVGLLVQQIANSVYANSTLIFAIEDDSQDGADHVDSHRSIAFVAGPYVKQGVVVSTQYNTVDFLRTIESVLNIAPLNINDALAVPMADVFDPRRAGLPVRRRSSGGPGRGVRGLV